MKNFCCIFQEFRISVFLRIFAFSHFLYFSRWAAAKEGGSAWVRKGQGHKGHKGTKDTADTGIRQTTEDYVGKRVHDRGQDRRIQLQRSESAQLKIRRLPNGVAYRERSVSTEADQMLQCIEGRYWHDVVGGRREVE